MSVPVAPASRAAGLFAPAAAIALVVVGVVAFCILFVGKAFDEGTPERYESGANAISKSAVGYAGFAELLKNSGRAVVVARGPLPVNASDDAIIVVTIDSGDPKTKLGALPTTRNFDGAILAVVPKWDVTGDNRRRGFVKKVGLRDIPIDTWIGPTEGEPKITLERTVGRAAHRLTALEDVDENGATVRRTGESMATGAIESFQTFAAPDKDWQPVIVDEQGRMVLMKLKERAFYALAEPDLLNNQGIKQLDNAKAGWFVLDHVASYERGVIFDVTLNGFNRTRSILKTMFQPPFLAATLCGLAALLLIIWHGFFRFGRERAEEREFALGKRALADNQAALIKMARREHRLGGRYAEIIQDLVARAVAAPRDLSGDKLADYLDRLGANGRTSWPVTTLIADLEKARDAGELVTAAGRLHHWRLEMTRERQ